MPQPLQSRTLAAKGCAGLAQPPPALGFWRRDVVPTDWLQMGTDRGDGVRGKTYRIAHNIPVLAVYTLGFFLFFSCFLFFVFYHTDEFQKM